MFSLALDFFGALCALWIGWLILSYILISTADFCGYISDKINPPKKYDFSDDDPMRQW